MDNNTTTKTSTNITNIINNSIKQNKLNIPNKFIGDGEFEGDGGSTLQRLWDKYPWKNMKVHCPGRYFISKIADDKSPEEIMKEIDSERDCSKKLIKFKCDKDPIILIHFLEDGGGALMSYDQCMSFIMNGNND